MIKGKLLGRPKFRLSFTAIDIPVADGTSTRAAVISVSEIGSPTHVMAALALVNGVIQQQVISRTDFNAAKLANKAITLIEKTEEKGRLTLFGPNGRSMTFGD